MTILGALILAGAFAVATALVLPAARRTSLRGWHPALAWLALEAVFFGVGAFVLSLDGRTGPALYVAGAVGVFGLAVWASDRLASGRGVVSAPSRADDGDPSPVRWPIVAGLVGLGIVAIAPALLRVGIPFLVEDITSARTEITGLAVQLLRVALPAAAIALSVRSLRPSAPGRDRLIALGGIALALAFELALASRYLPAELLAGLLIAAGLAGRQWSSRLVAALVIVAVLAFGGVQVLRAYDQAAGREFAFAVERTVNRLFLIQPRTLEALQVTIPDEQPYFGGLTWLRRLGPAIGRPDVPNLGYWIYPRLFPGQETPGYAAPGLLGEAWANFGPLGLALFGGLGVAVERFGALLARRRYGTADVAAGALLVLFVARTHALGVNGLAVLVVLVVGWRLLAGPPRGLAGDVRATLRWQT